jgi:hypothetical protein
MSVPRPRECATRLPRDESRRARRQRKAAHPGCRACGVRRRTSAIHTDNARKRQIEKVGQLTLIDFNQFGIVFWQRGAHCAATRELRPSVCRATAARLGCVDLCFHM